jgi:flagellar biosynthesis/type III secretory pathway protein FliH
MKLQNKIKTLGFALSLLIGFLLFSSIDVQAQYNRQNQDRNDRYENNSSNWYRKAMQQGYQDGFKLGKRDARSGRQSQWRNSGDYRNSNRGYNSRNGGQSAFRRAYQSGFERGYSEAFNRFNRRNNRNNRDDRNDRNDRNNRNDRYDDDN